MAAIFRKYVSKCIQHTHVAEAKWIHIVYIICIKYMWLWSLLFSWFLCLRFYYAFVNTSITIYVNFYCVPHALFFKQRNKYANTDVANWLWTLFFCLKHMQCLTCCSICQHRRYSELCTQRLCTHRCTDKLDNPLNLWWWCHRAVYQHKFQFITEDTQQVDNRERICLGYFTSCFCVLSIEVLRLDTEVCREGAHPFFAVDPVRVRPC